MIFLIGFEFDKIIFCRKVWNLLLNIFVIVIGLFCRILYLLFYVSFLKFFVSFCCVMIVCMILGYLKLVDEKE